MAITITTTAREGKPLEEEVDEDLRAFEQYFTSQVDPSGGPRLSRPEYAILKTYLWWKTHEKETKRDGT